MCKSGDEKWKFGSTLPKNLRKVLQNVPADGIIVRKKFGKIIERNVDFWYKCIKGSNLNRGYLYFYFLFVSEFHKVHYLSLLPTTFDNTSTYHIHYLLRQISHVQLLKYRN